MQNSLKNPATISGLKFSEFFAKITGVKNSLCYFGFF
jgi:hypothetical protein